jgi:foldase protein PrsA
MADRSTKSKTTRKAKTTAKAKAASTTRSSRKPVTELTPAVPSSATRSVRVKKSYVLTGIAIIAFIALLYVLWSVLVAATVNGQPISRIAVIRELERQGGKQALDSLVTKSLITQEAQKKNISVSQKEVDDELKKIDANLAKQGQKLDQVLTLQGMTKAQLVDQIRLQKMIEKMIGKVSVTDKEIADYIESNKESLPQDQSEDDLKKNVKTQLEQQKLNQKAQALLESLRKNAKVSYHVSY